jgi:hypothetical protein
MTRDALGGVDNDRVLLLDGVPAPATEEALLRDLSAAFVTGKGRDPFTAMGAFHLFLLKMEILDKSFNIPLIPFDLGEESPRRLIREKAIEVIAFPGEEVIEVYLSYPLFFGVISHRCLVCFFHKNPILYRIASRFCQPKA